MTFKSHPNPIERMPDYGLTESEIIDTVMHGESFPAKFNRAEAYNE
jgi:hypothetical protein